MQMSVLLLELKKLVGWDETSSTTKHVFLPELLGLPWAEWCTANSFNDSKEQVCICFSLIHTGPDTQTSFIKRVLFWHGQVIQMCHHFGLEEGPNCPPSDDTTLVGMFRNHRDSSLPWPTAKPVSHRHGPRGSQPRKKHLLQNQQLQTQLKLAFWRNILWSNETKTALTGYNDERMEE